jgi:hypothetical protein
MVRVKRVIGLFAAAGILFFGSTYFNANNWHLNLKPPENLRHYISEEISFVSDTESRKLREILSQPFHYLDEGGQSYVFVSEDNQYILKLFKYHRFRTPWFISYLPDASVFSNFKQNYIDRREKKLRAVLKGHQIAYSLNRENSGLYFVQLIPSRSNSKVVILESNGGKRNVDLGKTSFVLQAKGEIVSEVFYRLLSAKDVDTVKQKCRQILDLYKSEYLKGIYDTDHGVMHNIGFVNDKPLHIDVGNFVEVDEMKDDPHFWSKDLEKVARKMQEWVEKNFPEYSQEISDELQAFLL